MAIELDLEVRIARPPADVFTHLAAVETWPSWLIASGIIGVVRPAGAGPLAKGSTLAIEQRLAGVRTATIEATVTAFDEPRRLTVSGRDRDGITVSIDAVLTADGPGTTLGWHLRIGLPLKLRVFESMAAPQVRRAAALDLDAFRRRLGSVAAD
jgi:uncharacterized protein YndB with AHSA1/START domain